MATGKIVGRAVQHNVYAHTARKASPKFLYRWSKCFGGGLPLRSMGKQGGHKPPPVTLPKVRFLDDDDS